MKAIRLIRAAVCLAAIASASAASATQVRQPANGEGGTPPNQGACKAVELSDIRTRQPPAADRGATDGYADAKDFKLIFACPGGLLPKV